MKEKDNFWLVVLLWLLLISGCLISITSCSTARKIEKAKHTFDLHPIAAANYFHNKFPVVPDTVFRPGKPIVKSDTTYLPGDSVPCPPGADTTYVPCPPTLHIRDSVFIHDTTQITKKDSAELTILWGIIRRKTQDSIKASVESKSWKHKARNRGKIIWIAVSIIVLVGGGWIFLKGKMGVINYILKRLNI